MIFIANKRVFTRLQKEMSQLQLEFSQLDAKLDARFKEMQAKLKGEIRSELQFILDQYLELPSPVLTPSLPQDKGKRILGGQPLGFPPKEAFLVFLM